MTRLRLLTSKELEKILFSLGFRTVRQKGSHVFYKHDDGRVTTIPHHKGTLSRSLLRTILKDVKLSIDDFNNLL